ncbi:MAG: hypothetical protein JPMHGGIA_02820 [Saprospiraceae bacterium]|nr:hypothetical protein [Saprospiraceae bacterium]
MKYFILTLCLFVNASVKLISQSPVWPFGTNPYDYNTDPSNAVPSELISWIPNPSSPVNSSIPLGPKNTGYGPASVGFDCCGNMVFYAIHAGGNLDNQLFLRNEQGLELLYDMTGTNIVGLNGVWSDSEVQVVGVPGKCDEWYIVYLANNSSLSAQENAYNTKPLLYSHVKFNSTSGHMEIVANRLNVPLNSGPSIRNYQHGKASTSRFLYVIRRNGTYQGSGDNFVVIEKFEYTASGINYTGDDLFIDNVTWYYQASPSSPLELNAQGNSLAFLNYDEANGNNNIYLIDVSSSTMVNNGRILTDKLKILPHNLSPQPSGYPTGSITNYNFINYPNQSDWLNCDQLALSTILNLKFLNYYPQKIYDLQFSPNGNILYLTGGGYIESRRNNFSYITQIPLNTLDPISGIANANLKIQMPYNFLTDGNIVNGGGRTWSAATDPNYYNSHPIGQIQSAVNGNLYFTKVSDNKLYVLPNPNTVWGGSDLYAREIDLSIPLQQNVNTQNDIFFLPDQIDGYDYSRDNTIIAISSPFTSICQWASPFQLTGSPAGGTWSGSSSIGASGLFTPNSIGNHIVYYTFKDCIKSVFIEVKDCSTECCPEFRISKDTSNCKIRLSRLQDTCKDSIVSISISLYNGNFSGGGISSTCTGLVFNSLNYIGSNSVTLTNICKLNAFDYFDIFMSPIDCKKYVVASFNIVLASGKLCYLEDSIKCPCPPVDDCCAKVEALFAPCEPLKDLLHGKFTITNLNPSAPICKVIISPTPSASFANSGLMIDGNTKPIGYWNPTMIPSTGVISPAAVNTIMFNLAVDISYSGNIQVTVIKCDSSMCTFPIKWKGNSGPKATISPVAVPVQIETGYGLSAFQFRLIGKGNNPIAAKYCAIGLDTTDQPEIFAISGAMHSADSFPSYLEPVELAQMGNSNAFFGACCPRPLKDGDSSKIFNLVLKVKKDKGKSTKLRFTLFDEEGGIIYSDTLKVQNATTEVTTSIIKVGGENTIGSGEILQVYPNPATNELNAEYILGRAQQVKLELFTISGTLVQLVFKERKAIGLHQLLIDTTELPSGSYFLKISTEAGTQSTPFQIIK